VTVIGKGRQNGDMLWNVRSECVEDEGTDCEDRVTVTVTVIGKGRQNGDMLWNVRSECVENEGTDCDSDSNSDW
jgi:hypothetical protein